MNAADANRGDAACGTNLNFFTLRVSLAESAGPMADLMGCGNVMIHASTTDSSEEKERILRLRSQVAEQTVDDGGRTKVIEPFICLVGLEFVVLEERLLRACWTCRAAE